MIRLEENGFDINSDQALGHILVDNTWVQNAWENVGSDARLKRYCKDNLGLIEAEAVFLGTHTISGKKQLYQ